MRYEAIIWDCDGVLIDSEALACSVEVKILEDLGYKIPLEDYYRKFLGKSPAQMFDEIERETGLKLEKSFPNDLLLARQKEIYSQSLQATAGIRDVLDALNIPMAVASGSNPELLGYALGLTNLAECFNGHIYSAELVKKGKPAPDIFLHAAGKLNVPPERCLVVEDSIHGINAAKAAGMDVYAYLGGSHMTQKMREDLLNMEVQASLNHMQELLPLLHVQPKTAAG
ncbi:MAG: HAD family phosphatase [Pseudomonadota bacterium]